MPTNKQRREASRRHLERQLQRRTEQDAARKRFTLIASIVGTIVVIAVVVVFIVAVGNDSKKPAAAKTPTPPPTVSSSAAPACPGGATPIPAAKGAGKAVSFRGVTVKGATDLAHAPSVGSTAKTPPAKLLVKDLVLGKGTAATPKSKVSVQYVGALYCDGTMFDSSWARGGKPVAFPLTGVIPGFTQGIGGTSGVAPMKVGGRRIVIMPAALGYGPNPQQGSPIPPNAPLVFVVDLKSVTG